MAFDAARQRMVLFGGSVESGATPIFHNDTWMWDGNAWTLAATTGPGPRRAHAMAYDPISQTVIMHGGAISQPSLAYYQDTWAWNGTAWQQRITPNMPAQRDWHTLAFDPSLGEVVMFGGLFTPPTQSFDTTFRLGPTGWSQIMTVGPTSRGTQAMCLDSQRQRVIMFGGLSLVTGRLGDTWDFDGTRWREIASSGPGARQHVMMAFDEARGQTVLFGGSTSGGVPGDTWVWTYSVCTSDYNCDGIVDFFDYLDFVDVFSSNGPGADFNRDDVVDFFDYLDFVDAFSTGC